MKMKRLYEMRIARGWTRADLARRTLMDMSDIGRIESGRMAPYPAQIEKLCAAFGVPADESDRMWKDSDSDID